MKKAISTLLLSLCIFTLNAQDLPKNFTKEELQAMPFYVHPQKNERQANNIPQGPLRTMAEWEEIQSLIVTWRTYTTTLREIVRHARMECEVIIICNDSNAVKASLMQGNVPLSNVRYLQTPSNSVWARDYSGNTVYKNDVDTLIYVDWIYNRPRPNDDVTPTAVANFKNIPLYTTTQAPNDLVHSGGNFMSDGFGTAFSSNLILEENAPGNSFQVTPKSEAEVDEVMQDFMGINRYIKMTTLPYDGIHHIDMHMKILDEETLLVGQYPQDISDGPQIEANIQYVISNFNSVFSTPYKVIRIPMPPSQSGPMWPSNNGDYLTYTNSVFVNKTLLMPIYYPQYDTTALRIMRAALPGYKVQGIDCNSIIAASGALHCITHSIGVNDPLLISHQALNNTTDTQNPYLVNALIKHKAGINIATLHYSTDTTQGYQTLAMQPAASGNNRWEASIPAQPAGTTIYYYIRAEANSGKIQKRPITAAQGGYWKFDVSDVSSTFSEMGNTLKMGKIYPNPGKGITCIPIESETNMAIEVEIFDAIGKKTEHLYSGQIGSGIKNVFVNTANYPSGIYHVKVSTPFGIQTQKLAVK